MTDNTQHPTGNDETMVVASDKTMVAIQSRAMRAAFGTVGGGHPVHGVMLEFRGVFQNHPATDVDQVSLLLSLDGVTAVIADLERAATESRLRAAQSDGDAL